MSSYQETTSASSDLSSKATMLTTAVLIMNFQSIGLVVPKFKKRTFTDNFSLICVSQYYNT